MNHSHVIKIYHPQHMLLYFSDTMENALSDIYKNLLIGYGFSWLNSYKIVGTHYRINLEGGRDPDEERKTHDEYIFDRNSHEFDFLVKSLQEKQDQVALYPYSITLVDKMDEEYFKSLAPIYEKMSVAENAQDVYTVNLDTGVLETFRIVPLHEFAIRELRDFKDHTDQHGKNIELVGLSVYRGSKFEVENNPRNYYIKYENYIWKYNDIIQFTDVETTTQKLWDCLQAEAPFTINALTACTNDEYYLTLAKNHHEFDFAFSNKKYMDAIFNDFWYRWSPRIEKVDEITKEELQKYIQYCFDNPTTGPATNFFIHAYDNKLGYLCRIWVRFMWDWDFENKKNHQLRSIELYQMSYKPDFEFSIFSPVDP